MATLPSRLVLLTSLLLAATTLTGCLGGDDAPATTGTESHGTGTGTGNTTGNVTADDRISVEGFVLDESRTPITGARVVVQNEGLEATTDDKGHYSFSGFLDNRMYVLIGEHDGYERKAQQIVAIKDKVVRLDFVLVKEPTETPYSQILEGSGLVSCQAFFGAGHDHGGDGTEYEQGCAGAIGLADPSNDQVLEFHVDAKAAGIVVEVQWEHLQPFAEFMMVTVESVGYGDLDKRFGQVISSSIIKIEVPQDDVAKYYGGQGGLLRVTVDVHYEDDDEQAAGAAFAYQQRFEVRVSNFYIEPQPRSYTAFGEEEEA